MKQICQNCKNEELIGAVFCSECGASLSMSDEPSTNSFPSPFRQSRDDPREPPGDCLLPGEQAGLYLSDYAVCLGFRELKEYTIGRASEEQAIAPDVDLTIYEGYRNGISRIHASLVFRKDSVSILDLDSANGTLLNSRKLVPRVPYPVRDGDRLVFGKLHATVILKR